MTATNITLPAVGTGTSTPGVATDSVNMGAGAAAVQFIKLVDGTVGGTLPLVIDANGADVDVTRIAAGTNLIGDVGLRPRVTGGLTIFRSIDLNETEEEIKGTAGQLYWYFFYNAAASVRYLKFYNDTAANVIVGTTVPVLTIPLPPTTAGHVSIPQGLAFSAAITAAATTGLADNDTGAPSANDVILNVGYA